MKKIVVLSVSAGAGHVRIAILMCIFCHCFLLCADPGNYLGNLNEKVETIIEDKVSELKKESEKGFGLKIYNNSTWIKCPIEMRYGSTILLIHGLDDPGFLWDECALTLSKKNHRVLKLTYPNDQAIAKSTEYLYKQLVFLKKSKVKELAIIAHSMGGLITRDVITHKKYYRGKINNHKTLPRLKRIITIGTPNSGSNFAHFQVVSELGEQFLHLVRGETKFMGFLFDGTGEAGIDLLPESAYLNELNRRPLPVDCPFTIIAGKIGSEVSKTIEKRTEQWKLKLPLLAKGIGKLQKTFSESSKAIGDGVVTIESAKCKGVADFNIVDGNHISMITTMGLLNTWPSSFSVIMNRLENKSFMSADSQIEKDEEVVFYPTHAYYSSEKAAWLLPVHGSIFEPEQDSKWRSMSLKAMVKTIGISGEESKSEIFKRKTRQFLVDNEGGKSIQIKVAGQMLKLAKSTSDGHFNGELNIGSEQFKDIASLRFNALTSPGDDRLFEGWLRLVPEEGVSIISDIDDTIKHSSVLNKKELMRNTFLKEFTAVEGMSELYQKWRKEDAAFHYVSSSPWQLYRELERFLEREGFPKGQMHLKTFRIKDSSILSIFKSPMKTKVPSIAEIIKRFPKRTFILVGDSGEKDPEVYGEITRTHAEHIKHIYIRRVPEDPSTATRFETAFKGIAKSKWTAFEDAKSIKEK